MRVLTLHLALVVAACLAPSAHAFEILDIDGDGRAVTFLDHQELACPPGGNIRQIGVAIEGLYFFPTPGAPNPDLTTPFHLIVDEGDPTPPLLMQVRIPHETLVAMLGWPPPEDVPISGRYELWFPLHCDDGCSVSGRESVVGDPSSWIVQDVGGPPGPPLVIGEIGGGGGPNGEGIPIEEVGTSGDRCVELAVQSFESDPAVTGGDNVLCCGQGGVPAVSQRGAIGLAILLLALATLALYRLRLAPGGE